MAFNIFGFSIQSAKERQKELEKEPVSFVPKNTEDGTTSIASAGGYFGQYLDLDGDAARTDTDLIRKYRIAAEHPELDSAIDDIANEAIVATDNHQPVDIVLDDLDVADSVKERISEEFKHVLSLLKFDTNGHDIFRRWYVDGRLYYHVIVDEANKEAGISELRPIDGMKIRKVREVKEQTDQRTGAKVMQTVDEYFIYSDIAVMRSDIGLKIYPDSICYVPSGQLDTNRKRVLSHLQKALKPVNQLRMMEDALVIYRLSRAPERRIFYIDVGNLPKGKAEEYMRSIMNQYRNKIVYDSTSGEIKEDQKHMSLLEDFWLPRRAGSGTGTEITTLPGGENLGQTTDIEFFKAKLYRSLNIPVSRLQTETAFSMGRSSEITRDELKFQKFLDRLRKKFSVLFLDLLRTQCLLRGVCTPEEWEEFAEKLRVDYRKDSFFTEAKDAEVMTNRLQLLQLIEPYIGRFFSQAWVRRHVLCLTDAEVQQIRLDMLREQASPSPIIEPIDLVTPEDGIAGIEEVSGIASVIPEDAIDSIDGISAITPEDAISKVEPVSESTAQSVLKQALKNIRRK